MTPYQGLFFFYLMSLLLLPAVALGLLGLQKAQRYYGLFFTVAMLTFVFRTNGQLVALAAFYVWQTAICFTFWNYTVKRGNKRWIAWLAVILALLPLTAVKFGDIFTMPGVFRLLGISYMTFRAVGVLLDIYDGRLKWLNLLDFTAFLLFFPSVASGPVDRYRRFKEDINRRLTSAEYVELLRRGVWKLVLGAAFGIAISGLIWRWISSLPTSGLWATASYMYGYTLYLFFNFAGASSMAIGTANILGISLPENFNLPFLSVDMKDFWARWHISLSSWLRDYVYTRFVMTSLKAKRFKNQRTASYLGYAITMLAMGAWHGFSPRYLIYGAYHGFLMCLNEALDLHWKPFKQLKRKPLGQVCLMLVTFHLFSFGLLIFSGRII